MVLDLKEGEWQMAKSDADIEVSNAQKLAAVVKAQNEVSVAEAEKDRDVKKAGFKAAADTEKAKAEMAGAIESAAQQQTLKVAEAERDAAATTAQIKVQQQEAERKKAELQATIVATAAADRDKTVIQAEGERQKKVIEAEAEAAVLRTTAEARKNAAILEGEGDASKQRAVLLAQAEGKAAEKKQALLAEAEGTRQLADALKQMTTDARLIVILDKLPKLLETGGDAAEKVMRAIFESVAAPLGQIDEVRIIDMGGSNGGTGMANLAGIVPKTVFDFFAKMNAAGIDPSKLLSFFGLNTDDLKKMLGPGAGAATTASASEPATAPAAQADEAAS